MNQIILIFAFFGSAVLCEEVARKPKLFFVSTSATTSTLQTASICYVTSDSILTCTGRKRRICETRRGELEGEREQGGKVPPLLDHHHLDLHIHLLHNHLHSVKHVVHTGRRELMSIDCICSICLTDMFCYRLFPYMH